MSQMFMGATIFNQDISSWNVSSVTNMNSMFAGASKFNQDISKWNISNVTEMYYMLGFASEFNQDLSGWCVENILYYDQFNWQGILSPEYLPKWGESCSNPLTKEIS